MPSPSWEGRGLVPLSGCAWPGPHCPSSPQATRVLVLNPHLQGVSPPPPPGTKLLQARGGAPGGRVPSGHVCCPGATVSSPEAPVGTGCQPQVPGKLASCSDPSGCTGQGWSLASASALWAPALIACPWGWAARSPYALLPACPGSQGRTHSEWQSTQTHSPSRAGAATPRRGVLGGLEAARPADAVVCGPGFSQSSWASSAGGGHTECPLAAPQGLLGQASSGGRAGHRDAWHVQDGHALSAAGGPPMGLPRQTRATLPCISSAPLYKARPWTTAWPAGRPESRVLWKGTGPGTVAVPDGPLHGPGLRWA